MLVQQLVSLGIQCKRAFGNFAKSFRSPASRSFSANDPIVYWIHSSIWFTSFQFNFELQAQQGNCLHCNAGKPTLSKIGYQPAVQPPRHSAPSTKRHHSSSSSRTHPLNRAHRPLTVDAHTVLPLDSAHDALLAHPRTPHPIRLQHPAQMLPQKAGLHRKIRITACFPYEALVTQPQHARVVRGVSIGVDSSLADDVVGLPVCGAGDGRAVWAGAGEEGEERVQDEADVSAPGADDGVPMAHGD